MPETKDVRVGFEDFEGFEPCSQLSLFHQGSDEEAGEPADTACVKQLRARGLWGAEMDVQSPFIAEFVDPQFFGGGGA